MTVRGAILRQFLDAGEPVHLTGSLQKRLHPLDLPISWFAHFRATYNLVRILVKYKCPGGGFFNVIS